jgi:hypothetical protein
MVEREADMRVRVVRATFVSVFCVVAGVLGVRGGPAFAGTVAPTMAGEESVVDVSSSGAGLQAQLDPEGSATTYRFEYEAGGSLASYSPPGDAGFGTSAIAVESHVEGLRADTLYHYRVLASNAYGSVAGPGQTFMTQPEGGEFVPPDGRAWELVSPPDTYGGGIQPITHDGGAIQASESGGAITYVSANPPVANPPGNRAFEVTQVLSTRGAHGWSSEDIATPHNDVGILALGDSAEYQLFSSDLSLGLVEPRGETALPPLREGAERTIYLRSDGKCAPTPTEAIPATCYLALASAANTPPGTKIAGRESKNEEIHPRFQGASPDLNHVVFQDAEPLVEGASDNNLYEWSAGQLSLVSLLPGSSGPALGSLGRGPGIPVVRHAVSNNGSRVVWSSGGHLYLRDMEREETVQVDASEPGGEAGGEPKFQSASSDGSKVFFTDYARLTANSTADNSGEEADLYVFEVTSGAGEPLAGRLSDLTVDAAAGEHAAVQEEIIGASEDGSYVYFVANGVLGDAGAHGASPGDCYEREAGRMCNLYVEHFAVGGWEAPKFVATLSGEDYPDWSAAGLALSGLTARVSPDGRWVAFMSDQRLTGYDNVDVSEQEGVSGEGRVHADEEVYLFDAARAVSEGVPGVADNPLCASCDPTGARPVGVFDPQHELGLPEPRPSLLVDERELWLGRWLAGSVPGWTPINIEEAFYQSRYLSNNGRLFFNSADSLVPADVNGKEDVYEFEPAGVGGCGSGVADASWVFVAGDGGCVGLISSGTSSEESAFLDASAVGGSDGEGGEGGGDVFFLTSSQLASADEDEAFDVYDAHECSVGSPCTPAGLVIPPACATAESCRAPASPLPTIFGAPASATFNGTGNTTPPAPAAAVPAVKAKPLSRAQKLARALKACRKKAKRKRAGCEKQARRAYGARAVKAKSSLGGGGR